MTRRPLIRHPRALPLRCAAGKMCRAFLFSLAATRWSLLQKILRPSQCPPTPLRYGDDVSGIFVFSRSRVSGFVNSLAAT